MLVSDNKSMIISHETDQYEHCRLTHYFYFLVKKKERRSWLSQIFPIYLLTS